MQEQPTNTATEPMADEAQGTPLDTIISSVDSFMQNPQAITPEALGQLRADLEDLKSVVDGESAEPEAPAAPPSDGGMAGMIGSMRGGR